MPAVFVVIMLLSKNSVCSALYLKTASAELHTVLMITGTKEGKKLMWSYIFSTYATKNILLITH